MSGDARPGMGPPGADVQPVIDALRRGDLAIFATETLWSLSCRADDADAVRRVFEAKGRPEGVPLAVGFPSWEAAMPYVRATPLAQRLATRFLPGALSIIVARADDRLAHAAPGLDTLSVRVPDHPIAQAVLEAVGPCVMTSANRHGQPDPTTAAEVRTAFPHMPVAGDSVPGEASTVVDATSDAAHILREGSVGATVVEQASRGP